MANVTLPADSGSKADTEIVSPATVRPPLNNEASEPALVLNVGD